MTFKNIFTLIYLGYFVVLGIIKTKKGEIMEWAIIKWILMFLFYLCALIFAIITGGFLWTAYEERKIWKGKDFGWKLFPLLAVITGIFSCIFVFLGNLFR